MIRTLRLNDKIASASTPDAYLEVLDPKPKNGCIKVFDAVQCKEHYVEVSKLQSAIHDSSLIVIRPGRPRASLAGQATDGVLIEQNSHIRKIMRDISDIQQLWGCSFLQAYCRAKEIYQQQSSPIAPPFPTQATIYRYRQKQQAGLPALCGDKNKGNRTSRYPEGVINIVCTLAELYLKPQSRWTLNSLTKAVNQQVSDAGLSTGRPISKKYVQNVIKRLLSVDPSHDRMLPTDAVAGKSIAKKRLLVEMLFERVEQDAVHLPFVVETPTGISSQVWLVHAIDCCTSYPLGWQLVVGAPVDSDTLACVEMYMSPAKQGRFKQLKINYDKNVYGTPSLLVFDNGAETKGSRIKNLEKLGVDVLHCRARAVHEKPFIERLNRSLKEALETLAGCTRLDGEDGKRDPVAHGDKLITLEELERWVVRWYYEKWIHTPLERFRWDVLTESALGETPAERMQYFEDECFATPLPPSRSEWLAALYEHTERRLSSKTGITVDGLHYKDKAITSLLNKYGEKQSLKVLFNPDDFRHVFVYEGDELPLVTLTHEYVRPETPAWSFKEAKERLKKLKTDFQPAAQAEQFDRDLHEKIIADSLAKRRKPSKYDRNRETAQRHKDVKATQRAAHPSAPLPPTLLAAPARPTPVQTNSTSLLSDEAPLLPILNKNSGGKLS